ncbi:hypothetical protein FN846DRAFT_904742 [Sphaerosporella brunnea]|uniref:Uncharacterized protein n=1 Tax=Sphaerosporella brunnea TaxID=1250544 RepID=A0A5J5F3A0_9PEZI|nr:hypothetical protein FN846DRAFT_904742 [Sphaerosporella brunnea]
MATPTPGSNDSPNINDPSTAEIRPARKRTHTFVSPRSNSPRKHHKRQHSPHSSPAPAPTPNPEFPRNLPTFSRTSRDLEDLHTAYNAAYAARRSRLKSKKQKLHGPEYLSDDSDDSVDWQVALRLPVGVRPRKRLPRDPEYQGPGDRSNAPFIWELDSSDDDEEGGVDCSGEARRRRRRRMAQTLEESGEKKDVSVLKTVMFDGEVPYEREQDEDDGGEEEEEEEEEAVVNNEQMVKDEAAME